jgi:hypothetical protein
MSNKEKIDSVMAKLDAHNRKTRAKVIAKAVALNIVLPIVATVATAAVIEHLNKDK